MRIPSRVDQISAAPVYIYPRTNPTLVMTKPMNSAELTIRIATAFSVHLTNAKLYSPASVG